MVLVKLESFVRGLSVLSFILLCWVAQRSLQVRQQCVNSTSIAYVRIGETRVENCRFSSRLELSLHRLSYAEQDYLRRLESAEPSFDLFASGTPRLSVELLHSGSSPHEFELQRGGLRLGLAWLDDATQLRRALAMAQLKVSSAYASASQFQLEVLADFLLLALDGDELVRADSGKVYSLKRDVRFPTATPNFERYCESPFRSLAHRQLCALPDPDSVEVEDRVWGLRPLLAAALWRVYDKLSVRAKLHSLDQLRAGVALPLVRSLRDGDVDNLVSWFKITLNAHLQTLGMGQAEDELKRTLKELEVEAPMHWEVTFDLTHTPAWREILTQLRRRSQFRLKERALVFTPAGEMALPSGLPVQWAAADIRSQKHVLIACDWPQGHQAVNIQARQFYAQQSCDKIAQPFWD